MANEIDILMDKDPLELSAQDIDAIIAYQRKMRAQWDSGVKPKKEKGPGAMTGEEIVKALGIGKEVVPFKRRF